MCLIDNFFADEIQVTKCDESTRRNITSRIRSSVQCG